MCPALILAARRKDSVSGRTVMLVVSISTRNGLSHPGAPSGNRWARVDIGFDNKLEIIRLSHNGSPNDRVKIRCLDVLNVYGTRPIKLIKMIRINKGAISDLSPFKLIVLVRDS